MSRHFPAGIAGEEGERHGGAVGEPARRRNEYSEGQEIRRQRQPEVDRLPPKSAAIAGSAVERTVESRFSMNSAQATISGRKMRSGIA